jgi:hypothetical protein
MGTWFRRLSFSLWRHRGVLAVALAALAVRLVWNLAIHPPSDFAVSDMQGYLRRADDLFAFKSRPEPYATLFPWGTHVFVFAVKWIFGKTNRAALGASFAIVGAIAVAYSYATAARLFPNRRRIRQAIGALLVLYYPWISLSGYVLSEPLFAATVAATAFYALRLADEGRGRDALWFGVAAALGTAFRPQMLLSVALIGLHPLLRRRAWHGLRLRFAIYAAIPLAIVLGLSIARSEHDLNRFGLVSTNGPLNYAFGRCHATTIEAKARDGSGYFGPPPLGALLAYEKKHPDAVFKLAPASGEVIKFKGHMWDADKLGEIADGCVAKSGWLKQAYYAVTHVVLLYGYNSIWPDAGLPTWRVPMAIWSHLSLPLVVPALVYGFLRSLARRRARELLVAMHLWALVGTAIVYFGDTRYRAPYDGIVFLLVLPVYADFWRVLRGMREALSAWRARRRAQPAVLPAPAPGAATLSGP